MSDPAALSDDERMLAEIAEVCMGALRKVAKRLDAAQDDEAVERLGRTLHMLARSARQTLALKARLHREARRDDREALRSLDLRRTAARGDRRLQLDSAMERLIWSEQEGPEAETLLEQLDALLDDAALAPDFLDQPVADQLQDLCRALGLKAEVVALVPGPPGPEPRQPAAEPLRRSSA